MNQIEILKYNDELTDATGRKQDTMSYIKYSDKSKEFYFEDDKNNDRKTTLRSKLK